MCTKGPVIIMAARKIIVGVDGSASSLGALRWAINTAPSLRASVGAVMAYSPTAAYAFAPTAVGAIAIATNEEDVRNSAQALLANAVSAVDISGQVRTETVADPHVWRALTESSKDALLLVIGHHPRGGLEAVLGSTARSCVQHATCPVVVIPERSSTTVDVSL